MKKEWYIRCALYEEKNIYRNTRIQKRCRQNLRNHLSALDMINIWKQGINVVLAVHIGREEG